MKLSNFYSIFIIWLILVAGILLPGGEAITDDGYAVTGGGPSEPTFYENYRSFSRDSKAPRTIRRGKTRLKRGKSQRRHRSYSPRKRGGRRSRTQGRYCTECSFAGTAQRSLRLKMKPYERISQSEKGRTEGRHSQRRGKSYPILNRFLPAFEVCAPGCTYGNWGIMGDARHMRRRSCHNTGRAIDVPSIRCQGVNYGAKSSRFRSFLSCMRQQDDIFVIFGNKLHRNHAHISLRSCEMGGVGKARTR